MPRRGCNRAALSVKKFNDLCKTKIRTIYVLAFWLSPGVLLCLFLTVCFIIILCFSVECLLLMVFIQGFMMKFIRHTGSTDSTDKQTD